MINPELKEQVNETTNGIPEDIVSPLQPTPVLPIEHPVLSIKHAESEEVNSHIP